jgi:hypothetical protein
MSSSNKVEWLDTFKAIDTKYLKQLQLKRKGRNPKYGRKLRRLQPYLKVIGTGKKRETQFNAKLAVEDGIVDIEDIENIPSVYQEAPPMSTAARGAPEYGFMEGIYGEVARRKSDELGIPITPSQAQASIWMGAADVTGVQGTSRGNFNWALQGAIISSAERNNISVIEAAHRFYRSIAMALMAVAGGEGTRRLLDAEEEPVAIGAAQ